MVVITMVVTSRHRADPAIPIVGRTLPIAKPPREHGRQLGCMTSGTPATYRARATLTGEHLAAYVGT
jgi:hypothetical protein